MFGYGSNEHLTVGQFETSNASTDATLALNVRDDFGRRVTSRTINETASTSFGYRFSPHD
jgi:hypothetical protein